MLFAYPVDFRRTFGRDMMLVFTDEARNVVRNHQCLAVLRFARRIVWDWLTTIVRETEMMRKALPLGVAAVLLLAVDWFTFHDLREPHTVKDYLTLFASLLVF